MRQSVLRSRNARSAESIAAYSHYLAMRGQLLGLTAIDGHKPTLEERELRQEICRACERLAKAIPACRASEIAGLAGYYSLLYTIGYHRLPETSFLERQRERLLTCWMAGDKAVQESDVYGMLRDSVNNPVIAVPDAHGQILGKLRESWTAALKKHGTFPGATSYEGYRRLSLVMKDSLDSYFSGESREVREELYQRNRITDFAQVGSRILTAYRQFVRSLFPAVMDLEEMTRLDISVLQELSTRQDLDYYDRQAYQLALAYESKGR